MFNYLADKLQVKNFTEILAPTLSPEQQLHAAIEDGLIDKMKHLIEEEKVDANARNPAGNLPIHTAAYFGNIDALVLLMTHNVDINAIGPRDNTTLHFAAAQGHLEMVKFLIDKGSNPAARNKNGKTAYDVAKGDTLRQYLLPLQFKHEDPTKVAANLPPGITPTTDPMAPKKEIAPPPTNTQHIYSPPTSQIPKSRDPSIYRPIQPDGFGSSVGNEILTAKFGNTREIKSTAPPPTVPAPVNPQGYSAGVNPFARGRYTTYDVNTNTGQAVDTSGGASPPTISPPISSNGINQSPPKFTIFNPNRGASSNAPSSNPVGNTAPVINAIPQANTAPSTFADTIPPNGSSTMTEIGLNSSTSVDDDEPIDMTPNSKACM